MKTAKQIMKGKRFIKDEMDRQFSKTVSDELWQSAEKKLSMFMEQYAGIPKGVHTHTDNYIFPAAAIYLAVRERASEKEAYDIIENAAIRNSSDAGRKIAKLVKLPGMKSLFISIWDPMTRKMFSTNSGFTNVFYPKKRGEFRMDVTACPYNRYLTELGCPELTKIFCANDDRCYGNLPGVEFKRKGTIGTGADRCDFYMRKL